ncbi:type I-U CRISPR-associated helicase/endonuclease Cas3 [Raineyella sp. W15-4]|uniref:type I-G CRISPR-associated helicase/endonuclease Cas3g n=1 Tax=Raineyella sp. W15-4 TaxID=3081651 RepID=UPI002953F459|nr:type I-U CRISPR-associated helicase/endonuclease Cas3 [Raineyella sp. W15-4]WOQ16525.1 type I-U CRISPR-associated helicase/endonuclease Cas3 [Raineyella sp. W15-4]
MSLTLSDFADFFGAVNEERRPNERDQPSKRIGPFAWQKRLLEQVAMTGRWPDVISAPTGSGKSAVVEVHVFANALAAAGAAKRVPRRLAMVVDRRALVDSHVVRAERIRDALRAGTDPVLQEVKRCLSLLTSATDATDPDGSPLVVAELRGGMSPDSGWIDDPSACTVIGATPDMWGSRLLLRGYGARPQARPREAGLLAYDAAMVLDESHLNRQLLRTAQRVAELTERFEQDLGVPTLQVVQTTATPAADDVSHPQSVIGVEQADLDGVDHDELARRLTRPKPVTFVESPSWPSRIPAPQSHIDTLVQQVLELCRPGGSSTQQTGPLGCMVNHVDTAVRVARQLKERGLEVGCWVGRKRPMDIDKLLKDHSELFDSGKSNATDVKKPGELFDPSTTDDSVPDTPAPPLDVLVATQTVEVGVDLDLRGLVTELASASALAQRCGRVNRRGRLDEAPVVVVGPQASKPIRDLPPYSAADLEEGRAWLARLEPAQGLSPWAVRSMPPPPAAKRRLYFMRPELSDAWRLAATSDQEFEDESLGLWLRDDLEDDALTAGLVLRGPLPLDDSESMELLLATPPHPDETYPVKLGDLRIVADRVLAGDSTDRARAFLYRQQSREETFTFLRSSSDIRPGDVVVIDKGHAVTEHGVVVTELPSRRETVQTVWGPDRVWVAVRDHPAPDGLAFWSDILRDLAEVGAESAQAEFDLQTVGTTVQGKITVPRSEEDPTEFSWLVVTGDEVNNADESVRQEWTTSGDSVPLDKHSEAVRDRAELMTVRIGLSPEWRQVTIDAAACHDLGKDHPGFQRALGQAPAGPLLAKSATRTPQQLRADKRAAGLPRGWRHEHRSVLHALGQLEGRPHLNLTLRLIGTSHGYGRALTPQRGKELCAPGDPAEWQSRADELYDFGEWASIVGETDRTIGVWACAYLEAVVRAADCQVSREGS